jgi:hypothetical protein
MKSLYDTAAETYSSRLLQGSQLLPAGFMPEDDMYSVFVPWAANAPLRE